MAMEYEYKVIDVADGSISSLLLGEGRIETNVLQAYINAQASEGWRMVFMEKVMQRHLVISDRETLMITFERKVPEEDRAARAAIWHMRLCWLPLMQHRRAGCKFC
jgi:hypothetical protein